MLLAHPAVTLVTLVTLDAVISVDLGSIRIWANGDRSHRTNRDAIAISNTPGKAYPHGLLKFQLRTVCQAHSQVNLGVNELSGSAGKSEGVQIEVVVQAWHQTPSRELVFDAAGQCLGSLWLAVGYEDPAGRLL